MKRVFRHFKKMLAAFFARFFATFVPTRKQILFNSFSGKQYSDNPKSISEKMHELYPSFKIIWFIKKDCLKKNKASIPGYVRVVTTSYSYFFNFYTSYCVVKNDIFTEYEGKRKRQFFVQTWHGDRGFKKILFEKNIDINNRFICNDAKVVDLSVAGSSFGESVYRTAFLYNGLVLKKGCPRNDILLHENKNLKSIIYKRLGIDDGFKILLFAPTFRKKDESCSLSFNVGMVLDSLNEKEKWICLIRAHVDCFGFEDNIYNESVIDVSQYPDMADLLLVSDVLITDYSSSALDFVLRKKPVVLFCPDLSFYCSNVRDFKVSPKESGLVVVEKEQDLLSFLRNINHYDSDDVYNKCDRVYGIAESGNSAELVCDCIAEHFLKK